MPQHLRSDSRPGAAGENDAKVRVLVIEQPSEPMALRRWIEEDPRFVVRTAATVTEGRKIALGRDIDVVVLDPELSDGWPSSTVDEAVERLGPFASLLVVCRSAIDCQAMQGRFDKESATIIDWDRESASRLRDIVSGLAAQRSKSYD